MKPSNDILEELSALRRADAKAREASVPLAEMMRRAADAPTVRDFAAAFAGEGVHVIAELKRASPSEGMIREDFRPVELARELEDAGAAALSVLCEPHRFLGDERYLADVRRDAGIPILHVCGDVKEVIELLNANVFVKIYIVLHGSILLNAL